jgi:hypothetical protein
VNKLEIGDKMNEEDYLKGVVNIIDSISRKNIMETNSMNFEHMTFKLLKILMRATYQRYLRLNLPIPENFIEVLQFLERNGSIND